MGGCNQQHRWDTITGGRRRAGSHKGRRQRYIWGKLCNRNEIPLGGTTPWLGHGKRVLDGRPGEGCPGRRQVDWGGGEANKDHNGH